MIEILTEIERRFIVKRLDSDTLTFPARQIVQGYFETPKGAELRVRINDGLTAEITRKTGFGRQRLEMNLKTDVETARFLFETTSDRVEKRRHLRDGWEVDFFAPPLQGLVIAEFEMPAVDFPLARPPWIHDWVEVTNWLTNRHLARLTRDLSPEGDRDRPIEELLPKRVPRIVLTGGPCSGKSTLMAELRRELEPLVHCVPETATIVIAQVGVKPPRDKAGIRQFQRTIYRVQRGFETISDLQAARDGKKALLLDRGVIDNAAYCASLSEFEDVCRTSLEYEYAQYDIVVCLAMPSREIFDAMGANNPARGESYDQAAALGRRIAAVWGRHPNFHLVADAASWVAKANAAKAIIGNFLASQP